MSVTHETGFRNSMCTAYRDAIDNGSTGSGGKMVFETAADAAIATVQFDSTSGTVLNGVFTLSSTPIDSDSASAGTIEHASVYDNDGPTKLFEISCQISAGEDVVVVSSLAVGAGATITLSDYTWTYPQVLPAA